MVSIEKYEDDLEELYWKYDTISKQGNQSERNSFKQCVRGFLRNVLYNIKKDLDCVIRTNDL